MTTSVSSGQGIGGLVIPPSIPQISSLTGAIQMSLLALDKLVRIGASGEVSLTPYNPAFEKWDAVAKCDIPVSSLRDMFIFQTDHFDVNDTNPNDVRFYVDSSKIPSTLGLVTSVVSNGAVSLVNATNEPFTNADLLIGKDYVRHLANILFNTPFGVDLFINETDLVSSVNTGLVAIWQSCASDLQNVSNTGTNAALQGETTHKYLLANSDAEDASHTSKYNICRELYKMLISRVPSRFTDLPTLQIAEPQRQVVDPLAENLYQIPLIAGDQILMRVVFKPHAQQSSFQNANNDAVIRENTRAYIIALNLV